MKDAQATRPLTIRQLWITNQIIVRGVDRKLLDQLEMSDEVSSMTEEIFYPIEEPIEKIVHPNGTVPSAGEQWGVSAIQAPSVWASGYRGSGAVIATIDTGVRGTHIALRNNFRSNYGWYDPYSGTSTPNDQNGHGTHTAGTIAGQTNGIGVAPDAKWISCKGCSTNGCSSYALLECGQWTACPTNTQGYYPNCALAPNAVSNSWGGGQGSTWYNDVIATWKAADIAPLFSSGNAGPACSTANSPADAVDAIAVGSTTSSNGLSSFSSVGPTIVGRRVKPDIAAPGSSVVSAYYTSDTAYATLSGTSMACPHAAGLSALLYGASPNLSYSQIKSVLKGGCQRVTSSGRNCGGISESSYPNNHVGSGRISATASFQLLRQMLPEIKV